MRKSSGGGSGGGGFCGLKIFGCNKASNVQSQVVATAHICRSPKMKPKQEQNAEHSRVSKATDKFVSMVGLRRKISVFRDIMDLAPSNRSITIHELILVTMEDLHTLYPEIVLECQLLGIKGASIDEVLSCFCNALRRIGDSWVRNGEWIDTTKWNTLANKIPIESEELVETALRILSCMIQNKRDNDNLSSCSQESCSSTITHSDANSTGCNSPLTPTSVLPDSPNSPGYKNFTWSSPLVRSLRVQAIGKLNPIHIKSLSFHPFPYIESEDYSNLNHEKVDKIVAEKGLQDYRVSKPSGRQDSTNYSRRHGRREGITTEGTTNNEDSKMATPQSYLSQQNVLAIGSSMPSPPPPLPPPPPSNSLQNTVAVGSSAPSPLSSLDLNTISIPSSQQQPPPHIPPRNAQPSPIKVDSPQPPPRTAPLSVPPPPPLPMISTKGSALPPSPPPLPASTAQSPPPTISNKDSTFSPPAPPPPPHIPLGKGAAPPPPILPGKGAASPPHPPGIARSSKDKISETKLKRSCQMGNLYRLLKQRVEGKPDVDSSNGRKASASSTSGSQGMAGALAEITKRSAYFQQIEEDVKKYAKSITELKVEISSFKTSDMTELINFHKKVESVLEQLTDETQVLARFKGFPQKKLETIRMAVALYSKLNGIISELRNWRMKGPVAQLLDKTEKFFSKIKGEIEVLEQTKDEESKKFWSHNINFDFHILVQIKEAMVDVSSNCMEYALKERREGRADPYADASANRGNLCATRKKNGGAKVLWRAFQFAYKVYNFAGGHDDRADMLTKQLAYEIETDP